MSLRHYISALVVFCTSTISAFAQDPQFSQFYASPMYLNPALTGNTMMGRFSANYRNQWALIPGAYKSYTFAYDHNVRAINSGIGLLVVNDKAGSAGLRFNSIGLSYSYNANLSRNLAMRLGARAARVKRDIDHANLVFGDQLLENSGSGNQYTYQKVTYADFTGGIIFYSRKYWAGASFDHLNKPNQSLLGGEVLLPIKYTVHGGGNITISRNDKGQPTSKVTLTGIYKGQEKWDQVDLGAYFTYEPAFIGVWYRGIPGLKKNPNDNSKHINQDAIVLLIGAEYANIRIGYSYDITISKLAGRSGGAHEISIVYEYATKRKKLSHRKVFVVPCPKF